MRRDQAVDMMIAERRRQKRVTEQRLLRSIARLLVALQKELWAQEIDKDDAVRGSLAGRGKEDLLASRAPARRRMERRGRRWTVHDLTAYGRARPK